jgi:hypothetical protein
MLLLDLEYLFPVSPRDLCKLWTCYLYSHVQFTSSKGRAHYEFLAHDLEQDASAFQVVESSYNIRREGTESL